MTWCREVVRNVWVAIEGTIARRSLVPSSQRLPLDRRAADHALATARLASRFGRQECAVSRAHSRGVGAAIVAPPCIRVGVDLVLIERVTERHATVVVSETEWDALSSYGSLRPALAWTLKEAAAKAEGDPRACFPHRLVIQVANGRISVNRLETRRAYEVGWEALDGLLCAWVLDGDWAWASSSTRRTKPSRSRAIG
jgi:phosphopantetheinyl transferase